MDRRKLVVKKLSESDLTLFEYHYNNTIGAKQKSFNLDRSVLIDVLYPGLTERTKERIPLDLSIYGPGLAVLHNLQRKILKQQKNWRLDGELIHDPPEGHGRYGALQKGDFAILEFFGDTEPNAARMYLVARSDKNDSSLYNILENRFSVIFSSRKGMEAIDTEDLHDLIEKSELISEHPILDIIDAYDLEDAVHGGVEGIRFLQKRRRSRGVSRDEFSRAQKNAEKTGRLGEELLNEWFVQQYNVDASAEFVWVSDSNAISPFDFQLLHKGIPIRLIDAKSTTGDFSNPIHVSMSELEEMVQSGLPYDIYRLYSVNDMSAKFKVAENIGFFAKTILETLSHLRPGVRVDSFSIDPIELKFGNEQSIYLRESDNADEGDFSN